MMLTRLITVVPFVLNAAIAQPIRSTDCKYGGIFKTNDDGENYCDCTNAYGGVGGSPYRGHLCEHAATEYCEYGVTSSKVSFCANGGTCKEIIYDARSVFDHMGCDCGEDYEGPHCEYFMGMGPRKDVQFIQSSSVTSSSKKFEQSIDGHLAGYVVFIAVVVGISLAGFVILGSFVYLGASALSEISRGIDHSNNVPNSTLSLDPDGSAMLERRMMGFKSTEKEEEVNFSDAPSNTEVNPILPVNVQDLDTDGSVLQEALSSSSLHAAKSTPLPDDGDDANLVPAADTTESLLAIPPTKNGDDDNFEIC
mmetsp:Transcript_52565/g.77895  ORF Transcript_52565/g.77895 Transcript_52565/m.77895 type:complete len:309 (-) Transcript_52565:237-1163(-)